MLRKAEECTERGIYDQVRPVIDDDAGIDARMIMLIAWFFGASELRCSPPVTCVLDEDPAW